MPQYTVYDKQTGKISKIIVCPESMIDINISETEDKIESLNVGVNNKINVNTKEIVKK